MNFRPYSPVKRFSKRALRIAWKNLGVIARYGGAAPRYAEKIWIPPERCIGTSGVRLKRSDSGRVLHGDWDLEVKPLAEIPKYAYCIAHWKGGQSWEASGAYRYMIRLITQVGKAVDGCLTLDDIYRRYEFLDDLFSLVLKERCLKAASDLPDARFREEGGIFISIGRNCDPIVGGGIHRFAIARMLNVPIIPAQIGVVHPDAIEAIEKLRHPLHSTEFFRTRKYKAKG